MYETLEHHLTVAEAAQRLRLPLLSKTGEIQTQEEDSEKLSSRSSFDSTTPTSISPGSTTNLYSNTTLSVTSASGSIAAINSYNTVGSDVAADPPIGGVADRFLGITPAYLYQTQREEPILSVVRTFISVNNCNELCLMHSVEILELFFWDHLCKIQNAIEFTAHL